MWIPPFGPPNFGNFRDCYCPLVVSLANLCDRGHVLRPWTSRIALCDIIHVNSPFWAPKFWQLSRLLLPFSRFACKFMDRDHVLRPWTSRIGFTRQRTFDKITNVRQDYECSTRLRTFDKITNVRSNYERWRPCFSRPWTLGIGFCDITGLRTFDRSTSVFLTAFIVARRFVRESMDSGHVLAFELMHLPFAV